MAKLFRINRQFALALVFTSCVGVLLFGYTAVISDSLAYKYLLSNLLLAWIPLILAARLVQVLRYKRWSSWEALLLSFLWFIFLPNSFYMISDFIHLQDVPTADVVYYAVTFTSIIYSAVIIGFISLYMVHKELKQRLKTLDTNLMIALILASSSLAIYIGRDLRWNSWDVLTNPGGVIFDISYRLTHFSNYHAAIETSGLFFILLSSMYILVWNGLRLLRPSI